MVVAKCVWNSLKCAVVLLPSDSWDVWCPRSSTGCYQLGSVSQTPTPAVYKPHGQWWQERPTSSFFFFSSSKFSLDEAQASGAATQLGFLTYQVVRPSTWGHTCLGESRSLPARTENPAGLRPWRPGWQGPLGAAFTRLSQGGKKNQARNFYFKIIYLHIIGMKTGFYIWDGTGQIPYRNIQSIQKPLANLNKMDKYISK